MSLRSLNIPVIDFVGKRKIALIFSAILLIASIASLGLQGLKFGIDFTGGTLMSWVMKKLQTLRTSELNLQKLNMKGLMCNILALILKCSFS